MSIKYIFSINTGRSGSDYLTELLSKAKNSVSIHEGFPIMNGAPMQAFNEGDESALRALMPAKVAQIKKKRGTGQQVYCETNHTYIKGWGYLLPGTYLPQEEIGVIILRRDIEKTAQSLLRVHDVPGVSEWSRTWYLTPHARRNLSRPPRHATLLGLCQWYVQEIRHRGEAYKKQFPRITYLECDLEQLNNYDFVCHMFKMFGLVPSADLKEAVGKVFNPRQEWPKRAVADMLKRTRYPGADSLEPEKRDALVTAMVTYLHRHQADAIANMKPDRTMGGTFYTDAVQIVAQAERALEEAFGYALMFTETEAVLIFEFLRSVAPADLFFVSARRSQPPGIAYTYDFNVPFHVGSIIRKLGWRGAFKAVGMAASGLFDRDYTHRLVES